MAYFYYYPSDSDVRCIDSTNDSTLKINGKWVIPTNHYKNWEFQTPGLVVNPKNGAVYSPRLTGATPFGIPPTGGGYDANLKNKAIANLVNAKAQYGESLSEFKGTTKMVGEIGKRAAGGDLKNTKQALKVIAAGGKALAGSAAALKRGRMKEAAVLLGVSNKNFSDIGRDASGRYLELMFGILPLLEDMKTAHELFMHGVSAVKQPGMFVTTTASLKSKAQVTRTPLTLNGIEGTRVITTTMKRKVYMTYYSKGDDWINKLDRYGLGNPALIAYQATRMSFVLDWALPIGDFLQAFTSQRNSVFQHGHKSTFGEESHVFEEPVSKYPAYARMDRAPSAKGGAFAREVILDPSISIPRFQIPTGLGQAVTAMALVVQHSSR
uniref:Uncharacterized protein n=1 Tax=Beihai levi-like virus 15 TaxID=1922400 RepID=A0A1L3KIA1_9VIRU|nr:hypothetical protein [Beihai levi-like virus 15]